MSLVALTRVYHFSAGHRLDNPALSDDDNARLYGACARPHGHNYDLEVTVEGRPDPHTGMAVDLGRLDAVVNTEIIDRVDHRTLETVPSLAGIVTTGELLARTFWTILDAALPSGLLRRVAVGETARNRFEYGGTPS